MRILPVLEHSIPSCRPSVSVCNPLTFIQPADCSVVSQQSGQWLGWSLSSLQPCNALSQCVQSVLFRLGVVPDLPPPPPPPRAPHGVRLHQRLLQGDLGGGGSWQSFHWQLEFQTLLPTYSDDSRCEHCPGVLQASLEYFDQINRKYQTGLSSDRQWIIWQPQAGRQGFGKMYFVCLSKTEIESNNKY